MSLASAWSSRPPAQRTLIVRAALAIAVILVVTLVWLPLERARTRLASDMPAARASIAALQRDADEVKRLRSMPTLAAQSPSPLATLATNGGGLPGATMTVIDERRVRLTGADVGFSGLLEWLRNAQQTHGMRVESARIDALPAPGRVRAELVLGRN